MWLLKWFHVWNNWRLSLSDMLQSKACRALWENERDLVPFSFFSSPFWLVMPDARTSPSTPPPLPVQTLFAPLWSCTGVLGPTAGHRRVKNVFGVCPVSNRIVIIVSGCHSARWRGSFSVPVPLTGERERLKGSSLEGGKGRCGGRSQSARQPLKAQQHWQLYCQEDIHR